ncbi:MAG: hypothetical protein AAGH60_00715 [Pseudomonadota bacterium]
MPLYGWVAFGILGVGLAVLIFAGDASSTMGMQTGTLASIVAASALVVFLAGGMLGRGTSPWKYAREAMIWMLILVALVIGYTFWQRFA